MGRIKSALEIALERTESVKTDKASIGLFEMKQQGKRLANVFLEDQSKNLEVELKKIPKEQQESFKQGIFDVLIPQIALPVSAEDMPRIEAVGKGLRVLISDGQAASTFNTMFKQLVQVLSRYLDEVAHYDQAIRQQYAPKLRQKEEELSRRLGREVHLDPFQDPEFVTFYNQNLNALKANYQVAIDQVRNEVQRIRDEQTEVR
jgi:uncharacterized protein YukE